MEFAASLWPGGDGAGPAQETGPFGHVAQAVTRHVVDARPDALAVVEYPHRQHIGCTQLYLGLGGVGVAGDVGERLAHAGEQLDPDLGRDRRLDRSVEPQPGGEPEHSFGLQCERVQFLAERTGAAGRTKGEHRGADLADDAVDFVDPGFDALGEVGWGTNGHRLQLEAEAEQPLQHGVVQIAGDPFALVGQGEQIAGGAQHRLGLQSVAHVADHGDRAVAPVEGRQADLDRQLGAVGAQHREVHPRAHRPSCTGGEEGGPQRRVSAAAGRGHQGLDAGAHQVAEVVSGHRGHAGVDHDDGAVEIAHEHAVGQFVDPARPARGDEGGDRVVRHMPTVTSRLRCG